MIRARAGTTSSVRPSLALILAIWTGLALAACSSNLGSPSLVPTASSQLPGGSPTTSASVAPSPSIGTPDPNRSPSATPEPGTEESPTPSPSGAVAGASASCAGSASVRDFFSDFADLVDWPVYCAVGQPGWSFETGEYRLKNGGHLTIAYKGPEGAHLQIQEGAFCSSDDGCVPAGSESGEALFGDRQGSLLRLDGGGLALVVDRGSSLSWLAIGGNVDEETFRALCEGLHLVSR